MDPPHFSHFVMMTGGHLRSVVCRESQSNKLPPNTMMVFAPTNMSEDFLIDSVSCWYVTEQPADV